MEARFAYITLADKQQLAIHYRQIKGDGVPVIVLHPSPLSSRFMRPIMQVLASAGHSVIGWDTPGYGDSDALASKGGDLGEYADCLAAFMGQLGIDSAIIYGNATGAQIAIEFSKAYPHLCERLILENVAIFSDAERREFFAHYFPDLTPRSDGRHLQVAWNIVNQLFAYFPWYDTSPAAAVKAPMPPLSVIQDVFVDYIKAGEHYAAAYKAALNNERPEPLQAVTVQTDIVLWQDSVIKRYSERLTAISLPDNIVLHQAKTGMASRAELLCKILKSP